ncbi:MAG: hypothetical protein J0J15_10575 [Mesorhizobium sp.]|nr:hypothetical protein [Mesorhizobium sp.]
MTDGYHVRLAFLAPLIVSGLALAGCVGSPTYGTDKTAGEQLAGDLSNAFSFAPSRKDKIDYKPRPALVKPAPGQKDNLPAPQDSIETASANWPESPEQRRARLRAEATAHQDDPSYQSQIVEDIQTDPAAVRKAMKESGSSHPPAWSPEDSAGGSRARAAEINRKLAENRQGDPTTRRYLSDPPLVYREAATTAPQNDIGEDEYKKERRLKKEAAAKSGKSGWFDWLPW